MHADLIMPTRLHACRGGPATGQHVDILGNEDVLRDLLAIAAGRGAEMQDAVTSEIDAIAQHFDFEDEGYWAPG